MDKKQILTVNKLVFDFVLKLKDEDLILLLDGEKKIKLLDNEKNIKSNKVNNKVEESINKIYSYSNKEEATSYLKELTVAELKKVGELANIYIKSKSKKSEIIDRIIEGTIGARIKVEMLKF